MTRDSLFFWEGAKQDELRIQQCNACKTLHHPPRPMCNECLATDMGHRVMSGRGKVYSWIKPVHPPMPMFEAGYVVALVNLEEGPRLMSNICEIPFEDITNEMPVEVFFVPVQGGYKVPQFRPAR
jgi:uncharacterized OB-fold protein